MKMLILTSGVKVYGPVRLAEVAKELGFEVVVADYSDLVFQLRERLKIFAVDKSFDVIDFEMVILRGVGAKRTEFFSQRGVVARHLLQNGVRVLNGKYFADTGGGLDKLKQNVEFLSNDLAVVKTKIFGRRSDAMMQDWEFPLVLKVMNSSKGRGVEKVETLEEMRKVLRGKRARNILVQEFIPGGKDYRVIVLGGKCVGVISRNAPEGEFLTNVSMGGEPVGEKVDSEMRRISERVCDVLDLEFAGVDLVKDPAGNWLIYEVNDAPQFGGFESATGVDLAREILEYLSEKGE